MRRSLRSLAAMLAMLTAALSIALATTPVRARAMTPSEYWSSVNSFVNDSNWCNGTYWNQDHMPILSSYRSWGCWAYGSDFSKYVYGIDNYQNGSVFYNPSEIRTGDIIRIMNGDEYGDGAHTFVVLERDGNALWTAEGGIGTHPEQYVRVSSTTYTISGNTLYDSSWYGNCTITGYHFDTGGATTRAIDGGYSANVGTDFYACIIQQTSWTSVACGDTSPYTQLSISDTNDGRDPRRVFRFRRQLDGTYEISSAYWEGYLNSTWVVQPDNGNLSSGTIINLGVATSSVNQRWRVSRTDAPMQLFAGNSSLVLDVDSTAVLGTQLQLYTPNYSSAQQFNIYKVEYNGWTYEKPGKPSASSYTGPTSVELGESTTLTWSTSSLVNEWDRRTYDLTVTDSSGKVVLSKTGLTSTSYNYTFTEPGTYTVKVRANDTHYYQYYTDGPSATITVTGEPDTTPPVITSFSIYNQTDDQITFDVQATDDTGLSEVYCLLYTGLGTNAGKLSSGYATTTSNSQYSSATKVGEGHWRFTFYFENWGLVGDRHAVQAVAKDAAGNFSCAKGDSGVFDESRPTLYFDYQASPHITLNLGDTITGEELFEGINLTHYETIWPLNMILTIDGYTPGTGSYMLRSDTVLTATSVGTEPIVLINYKTAAKLGVLVTVVDPAAPSKIDLSDATVALEYANMIYTGLPLTPSVTVTLDDTTLTEGTDYTVSYSNNTGVGTATVTVTGKGNYEGSATATFQIVEQVGPQPTSQEMYRLYNQWTGEHFYTADTGERDGLVTKGWTFEGVGWNAPEAGIPVYRLYNPWVNGGDHHYTMDRDEYDSLCAVGWRGEGLCWYSDPGHAVPVYREYNPWKFSCNHNYTADRSEHNHLLEVGWRDEGIGWYGV